MKDFFQEVQEMNGGIFPEDDIDISENLCYDKGNLLELKCGYVCFECGGNVLAFSQPYECAGHE